MHVSFRQIIPLAALKSSPYGSMPLLFRLAISKIMFENSSKNPMITSSTSGRFVMNPPLVFAKSDYQLNFLKNGIIHRELYMLK